MTICAWVGYPNLFITFTCNHKWPELVDFLKEHNLKPEDRPDLVSRVFKIKLTQLIKDIKKGSIFGKVKSGKHVFHGNAHFYFIFHFYKHIGHVLAVYIYVRYFCVTFYNMSPFI